MRFGVGPKVGWKWKWSNGIGSSSLQSQRPKSHLIRHTISPCLKVSVIELCNGTNLTGTACDDCCWCCCRHWWCRHPKGHSDDCDFHLQHKREICVETSLELYFTSMTVTCHHRHQKSVIRIFTMVTDTSNIKIETSNTYSASILWRLISSTLQILLICSP